MEREGSPLQKTRCEPGREVKRDVHECAVLLQVALGEADRELRMPRIDEALERRRFFVAAGLHLHRNGVVFMLDHKVNLPVGAFGPVMDLANRPACKLLQNIVFLRELQSVSEV